MCNLYNPKSIEIKNNKSRPPSIGSPGGGGVVGGGGSPGAAKATSSTKNTAINTFILLGTIIMTANVKKKNL